MAVADLQIVRSIDDLSCIDQETMSRAEETWRLHEKWYVLDGKVCVAFAVLFLGKHVATFDWCFVKQEYRGQGLQRMLIERRLEMCRERGMVLAETYIKHANSYSRTNFEACGFVKERPSPHGSSYTRVIERT